MNLSMLKKLWLCGFCLSLLTTSCTNIDSGDRAINPDSTTGIPEETTTSSEESESELYNQIEQISNTAQGQVGVTATVLETGETVTLNGDRQFPMQSVYKFPIGMAVLAQVDQGKLELEQRVRIEPSDFDSNLRHSPIRDANPQGTELSVAELLRYTVSESDNTACDVLLRLVGGPGVVTQYLRDLGINDMVVANTEKEIGQDIAVQYRNYATPDAAVALLRVLQEGQGLSPSSQTLLLQLMTETPTGLQRIKGLLPEGTVVAHKTGTSRTVDGVTAATNDVGLVTLPNGNHLAVAVFVSDSRADDATREEVIARIARAAWDEWSQ
jgi:beta-lactamase class A